MLKQSCFLFAVLSAGLLASSEAHAQKKDVLVVKTWSGSVTDEKLQKDRPEAVTSAQQLEKIWKAWQIEDAVPKIEFDKFLVVAVYSSGSKLSLAGAKLDDNGNLEVLGLGTRDLRDGFRFVLGVVSNDGVKTVNGKKLP
ncbi:MAG: hypothetical protein HY040_02555 [Planctomycetes bacterium]|nr:hypothetical protein [Planctomycetota bacterium]